MNQKKPLDNKNGITTVYKMWTNHSQWFFMIFLNVTLSKLKTLAWSFQVSDHLFPTCP